VVKIADLTPMQGVPFALVLPEERYLFEVQTRKPDSGDLRGPEEIERIAQECLILVL
jgi:hypothetical protein